MRTTAVILVFIATQLAGGFRAVVTASPASTADSPTEAPRCCCCVAGQCACGCSAPAETSSPESGKIPKPAPPRYCGCNRAPLSQPPAPLRIVVERVPVPVSVDVVLHSPAATPARDRVGFFQIQAHGPPDTLEALRSIILLI